MTHFLNCILFSKYIQTHTSVHLLQLVFDTVIVAAVWSMHVFFCFFCDNSQRREQNVLASIQASLKFMETSNGILHILG